MDLKAIGYADVAWVNWAWDRVQWWALVKAVMNLWVQ
jgi:hypothetical protein